MRRHPVAPAMKGMGGRIWSALLAAGPDGAGVDRLADEAYRGCIVPESYQASIRCQVQRLGRAMRAEGYEVRSVRKGRALFYVAARQGAA